MISGLTVGRMGDSAGLGDSPDILTFSASLVLTASLILMGLELVRRKVCKLNGRDREKFFDASRILGTEENKCHGLEDKDVRPQNQM